jgi:hypothetical protein
MPRSNSTSLVSLGWRHELSTGFGMERENFVLQILRCCRGRDDPHGSPPAQIRTSASTHTALLKNEWRSANPRLRFASRTPSKRWDMQIPPLSQEHVRLNDVLLQLRPSLPNLRRSCRLVVRLIHRCRVGGGAPGCPSAGHRPPPKPCMQFSRTRLSRRLNNSRTQGRY